MSRFISKVIRLFKKKIIPSYVKSLSGTIHMTKNETLNLSAKEKLIENEVKEEAKKIFKENFKNLEQIFEYIKSKNTMVFQTPMAPLLCFLIKEDEGFILPQKGLKAFIITFFLKCICGREINISFSSPDIFIMREGEISPYGLAYQLFHWMAFKRNLSGYDAEVMEEFRELFKLPDEEMLKRPLTIEEILSIKEVIARDIAAIDVVRELSFELSESKKASDKLQDKGDISV